MNVDLDYDQAVDVAVDILKDLYISIDPQHSSEERHIGKAIATVLRQLLSYEKYNEWAKICGIK